MMTFPGPRTTAETIAGMIFSAAFMLLWLCCWPLYRLVREVEAKRAGHSRPSFS